MNKIINTITHYLFVVLVLGYIFYEELVWERFAQPIVRYVQSLKLLQKLEVVLQKVNGGVILVAFVLLFVIVELQGVYAGILLLQGKVLLWFLIYAGKIPIAAFTFWLFRVTKPKLMAFAWFEKAYNTVMSWIGWVKATDTYKEIKTKATEIKHYIKKNYMRDGDSIKKKFKRIYTRLKIRLKEGLKR
ncbi:MAG: hypothetical protein L3J51_08015 [Cocleimonas sp.]|nr:hypothetical protein [Cocleimonas sp.]